MTMTTLEMMLRGMPATFAPEGEGGSGGSGGDTNTSTGEGSGEGANGEGAGTGGDDNSAGTGQQNSTVLGSTKPGDGETSESGASEGEGEGEGEGETGPPEEYTFDDLPEGVEIDTELAGKVSPIFKELGLTNEQANQLAGEYAQHIAAQEEARAAQWQQTNEQWVTQAKQDPEIVEMGWDNAIASANRFIETFGDESLGEALAAGLNGNHPAIIKALAKAGAALTDDRTETGTTGGQQGDAPVEERWYGTK